LDGPEFRLIVATYDERVALTELLRKSSYKHDLSSVEHQRQQNLQQGNQCDTDPILPAEHAIADWLHTCDLEPIFHHSACINRGPCGNYEELPVDHPQRVAGTASYRQAASYHLPDAEEVAATAMAPYWQTPL
jgi:hypothetical protein